MRIDRPFTVAVAALALATAGCGSQLLQPKSGPDPSEIRELQQRILDLQRSAAVQKVELSRLRERVAELEARDGSTVTRRSPAAPATTPPDRVGRSAPRPATPPPADPTPLRDSPDLEVTEILEEEEIAAPTAPLPGSPRPAAAPPPAATLPPPSAAARAQYDRAYTLFHQGRFADAESAFQRFLDTHSGNDHADNAQYWIGESRYARDDLRGALEAFRRTVERYPGGNKVPDALLKAGQCLEKLGDTGAAAATYREVASRFPSSAAAAVSQQRLAGLP